MKNYVIDNNIYDWDSHVFLVNTEFTEETCRKLGDTNCRHCYGRGFEEYSLPKEKLAWKQVCNCVKKSMLSREK